MTDSRFRAVLLILLATATGWIGWSGDALLLPVAALFPGLWSLADNRREAAALCAAYFLAASRGLPQGVANFYASEIWPGIALWLAASLAFVAVHALAWTATSGWRKPFGYLAASVAMAVPPFGILGWAHPLTAAGILFPGWGWVGLAAMAACLGVMTTCYRPAAALVLASLWIASLLHWTPPDQPLSWQGIDLRMGASLGRDTTLARQLELARILRSHPAGTTMVLPESAIGFWTPTVARLWHSQVDLTGITLIAGAAIIKQYGYDNILVRVSGDGTSGVLYRERMPVPGSMWQPWRALMGQSGGASAYFFSSPVVDVDGTRIAPLICYEQLILWPVLQSMLLDPDIVVAVGNGWWTGGTSIVAIQRATVQAFARLFGKPLVLSFNT